AAGSILMSRVDAATPTAVVLRDALLVGFGLGITFPLFTIAVQNAFPPERIGTVTSAIQFFRTIGGTVGVAVMGTLMVERLASRLEIELAARVPAGARAAVGAEELLCGPLRPDTLLNPAALTLLRSQLGPEMATLADQ